MASKEDIIKALKSGKVKPASGFIKSVESNGKYKSVKMPTEPPGEYSRPSTGNKKLDEMIEKSKPAKMPMFSNENSLEQYIQEKNAGAALSDLPYDKWKKL